MVYTPAERRKGDTERVGRREKKRDGGTERGSEMEMEMKREREGGQRKRECVCSKRGDGSGALNLWSQLH